MDVDVDAAVARTVARAVAQWIAQGLNNAQLASIATYYDCVPGFKRLLAAEDNDLVRFYAAARELAHLPRAQRHAQLCSATDTAAAEGD